MLAITALAFAFVTVVAVGFAIGYMRPFAEAAGVMVLISASIAAAMVLAHFNKTKEKCASPSASIPAEGREPNHV